MRSTRLAATAISRARISSFEVMNSAQASSQRIIESVYLRVARVEGASE